MARIRSVHPDICLDETLAEVSARAERTFVRLWTHLDDEGRCKDNVRLLKAALYPLHDDMTTSEVEADLIELADAGLIWRYEVDGVALICTKPSSWGDRQKPRHPMPSKFGAPPEGFTPRGGGSPDPSGNTRSARRSATADRRNGSAVVGGGVGEGEGGVRGGPDGPPALSLVVDEAPPPPPPSFEDFWHEYPRKAGKGQARKAWDVAAKKHDLHLLVDGARRLARDPNLPEREFIPHPATWIRGERWTDEPLPPRTAGPNSQRRPTGTEVGSRHAEATF